MLFVKVNIQKKKKKGRGVLYPNFLRNAHHSKMQLTNSPSGKAVKVTIYFTINTFFFSQQWQ